VSFNNSDGRIRGARGVEIRRLFLSRNPLCVKCQEQGRIRAATEVDHVKPLHAGGADTDANKQALCKDCHRAKTNTEQGNTLHAQMFPEWLEPAACHLTIVFGPPGSGKSRHVKHHAGPGDVVIDLDEIRADISGEPIYTGGPEWLNQAVRTRNAKLGSLSRESRPAWFIVTGVGQADRAWWVKKLKPASVVLLAVPESECIARIKADRRRPPAIQKAHIEAVRAWWHAERGFAARSARKAVIGADGWPVD
jgi:hypothetical protein